MVAMDWYSWLSKTDLDPALVYEYGRTFTHNQLQQGDIAYFNHEFLQSMGISVAKHRLEILKLARKEEGGGPKNSLSTLIFAVNRTKKLFTKSIGKWVSHKGSTRVPRPEPSLFQSKWPGTSLRTDMGLGESKEVRMLRTMKSGPLDRKGQERYVSQKRVVSLSGPLDRDVQENLMFAYSSPLVTKPHPYVSGTLEDLRMSPRVVTPYTNVKMASHSDGVPSLWSLMFQDMKPT